MSMYCTKYLSFYISNIPSFTMDFKDFGTGYSTENLEHLDVYLIFKWMHLHVWMHWWVNDYVHLHVLTSIGFRSIFKGDLKIKSDTWNWTDILFIQHISSVASLWPQRSLRWGSVVVKAIGTVIIISYTEHLISKLGALGFVSYPIIFIEF